MKQHYKGPSDPTEQIHQVGDQNNYRNSPLSDFPKTIDPTEDSPEAEDSPEVEDIPEAEERHLKDHQEEVGDHHHCLCHKPIKEN